MDDGIQQAQQHHQQRGRRRRQQHRSRELDALHNDNDGRGAAEQQRSASQPNLIPVEQPSDFYASLVGIQQQRRRRKKTVIPCSSPDICSIRSESSLHEDTGREGDEDGPIDAAAASVSSSVHRVPLSDDDDTKQSKTSTTTAKPAPGSAMSKASTQSEMAHALNRAFADPPRLSSLALGKSNKGFRMLSAMGWSEEDGGLGKARNGSLVPVGVELKMDRKGLGSTKKTKRRVTHREEHIAAAAVASGSAAIAADANGKGRPGSNGVQHNQGTKAERKRRLKREAERSALRDKRARMLLSSDVSPEYEDLYMSLHR